MIRLQSILSTALGIALCAPSAHAEGTLQVGLGQRLVDDTVVEIDVLTPGEYIYISAVNDVGTGLSATLTDPTGAATLVQLTSGSGLLARADVLPDEFCSPYVLRADRIGTWTLRFSVHDVAQSWLRTLSLWDVRVLSSDNACVSFRNSVEPGRIHSAQWHLRANGYQSTDASDADFYIPTSRTVWILDFAGVAGFEYFVSASRIGLRAPYSRSSQKATQIPRPQLATGYRVYLNPPQTSTAQTDGPIAMVGARQDSEGTTLSLTSQHDALWAVVDARGNEVQHGVLGVGENEIRLAAGAGVLPYELRVYDEECHFSPFDVESARPGIAIHRYASGMRVPAEIHWDDRELWRNVATEDPVSITSLGMEQANLRHGWGRFQETSFGNDAWVDTWVLGDPYVHTLDPSWFSGRGTEMPRLPDSGRNEDGGVAGGAVDAAETVHPDFRAGGLSGGACKIGLGRSSATGLWCCVLAAFWFAYRWRQRG